MAKNRTTNGQQLLHAQYLSVLKSYERNLAVLYATKSFSKQRKILKLFVLGSTILTAIASFVMHKKTQEKTRAALLSEYSNKKDLSFIRKNTVIQYKMVDDDVFKEDIGPKLLNASSNYIETKNVQNLLSLPRYQNALMFIKRANSHPTQANYQQALNELVKLSVSCQSLNSSQMNNKLEELIRLKIIKNFDPTNSAILGLENSISNETNPFLNDDLANYLSQMMSDDLMLQMAFKTHYVDNRFFRNEPMSTIQKMKKVLPNKSQGNVTKNMSIYDDRDYGLIFETVDEFIKNFNRESNKTSGKNKSLKKFYTNKTVHDLTVKLQSELNSLIVSEHYLVDRPKVNVWSSYDFASDEDLDANDDDIKDTKMANLKQKFKSDFIRRNELLILNLVDKMCKLDCNEFVRLNGMELLLFLYEKYKYDEYFINIIGNCLCLISLDSSKKSLFVQSGWLKRLNQMCNSSFDNLELANMSKKQRENIIMIRELIGHKILFNLNSEISDDDNSDSILYSTMIYPLFPKYSASLAQKNHIIEMKNNKNSFNDIEHKHVVDVVFIHGLRGSLFKTWRINENNSTVDKNKKIENDLSHSKIIKSLKSNNKNNGENLIEKLNNLIENHINQSNMDTDCFPKDWLPMDINQNDSDSVRILGINYDTLYTLWGEDMIDDKKLKLSIKQRATDLLEQLKLAHVGENNRPVIWICHSMGGLIVKQIMVHLKESNNLKNNLLANTKNIVFLSTPHLGSSVAKLTANLSFATNPTTDIYELSTNSDYLIDLNKKFLNLLDDQSLSLNLKLVTLLEHLPTYTGYFNSYTRIVTRESGDIGRGDFYLINNKDHLNICKPDNRNDFMYKKVCSLINEQVKCENLNCEKCKLNVYSNEEKLLRENLFEMFKTSNFY